MEITDELSARPSREPDYVAENRALVALAGAMEDPSTILQRLAETAMELCGAGSAGVSVLETGDGWEVFHWEAIAGEFADYAHEMVPRDASPGGLVIERQSIMLFERPGRVFHQLEKMERAVVEALVAPFYSGDTVVGTVWAFSHDAERRFDAEDARLLGDLTRVASAAYHLMRAQQTVEEQRDSAAQTVTSREAGLSDSGEALQREIERRARAETTFRARQERLLRSLSRFSSATNRALRARGQAIARQHELEQRLVERNADPKQSNQLLRRKNAERTRAEGELRQAEARLRRALDISTVGIIRFKPDGRVTWANDGFLRVSGYSRADLEQGHVRWDVMTPEEWMPRSNNALNELEAWGYSNPYEKEYLRKDGSRWWGLCAATRVSEDESVEYAIDITGNK